jgi:ABC-type hemin transport system substrate-binding protein
VQATTELIITRRPDVIVEMRADPLDDSTRARETRVWGTLASVPAVRNRRISWITGTDLFVPGPRLAGAAERLAAAIAPR